MNISLQMIYETPVCQVYNQTAGLVYLYGSQAINEAPIITNKKASLTYTWQIQAQ